MPKRMPSPWQTPITASLLWLVASACSASSRPAPPIDCTAGDAYELSAPLRVFDIVDDVWFSGADPTGSNAPPVVSPLSAACTAGGAGGTSATETAGTGGSSTGPASI